MKKKYILLITFGLILAVTFYLKLTISPSSVQKRVCSFVIENVDEARDMKLADCKVTINESSSKGSLNYYKATWGYGNEKIISFCYIYVDRKISKTSEFVCVP